MILRLLGAAVIVAGAVKFLAHGIDVTGLVICLLCGVVLYAMGSRGR